MLSIGGVSEVVWFDVVIFDHNLGVLLLKLFSVLFNQVIVWSRVNWLSVSWNTWNSFWAILANVIFMEVFGNEVFALVTFLSFWALTTLVFIDDITREQVIAEPTRSCFRAAL